MSPLTALASNETSGRSSGSRRVGIAFGPVGVRNGGRPPGPLPIRRGPDLPDSCMLDHVRGT